MELILNELSMLPYSVDKYQARDKMARFSKTVSVAINQGFKNIKSDLYPYEIMLADDYSLKNWLTDKEVPKNQKDQLFTFIIPPFIKEEDEEIFEEFIDLEFYFENNDIPKTSCIGLAAAYLYGTLSISLASSPTWCNHKLLLIIEMAGFTRTEEVFNVYDRSSFQELELVNFVENLGELDLVKTTIDPEDKRITLFGDHHGKPELEALCGKLKRNDYVEEMRSTNYGGSKFIRKVQEDGVVEIVVMKADSRFALWVQTTGRNYRETKAIADMLRERYS